MLRVLRERGLWIGQNTNMGAVFREQLALCLPDCGGYDLIVCSILPDKKLDKLLFQNQTPDQRFGPCFGKAKGFDVPMSEKADGKN